LDLEATGLQQLNSLAVRILSFSVITALNHNITLYYTTIHECITRQQAVGGSLSSAWQLTFYWVKVYTVRILDSSSQSYSDATSICTTFWWTQLFILIILNSGWGKVLAQAFEFLERLICSKNVGRGVLGGSNCSLAQLEHRAETLGEAGTQGSTRHRVWGRSACMVKAQSKTTHLQKRTKNETKKKHP
jgi:hypothetical protein